MKKTTPKLQGENVLICGSQQFDDQGFAFMALEATYMMHRGNIRKIITSKFTGACEFARQWVELKNTTLPDNAKIEICDFSFDDVLGKKNNSFYNTEIPEFAIANHPFFQAGKEALIGKGVNLVLAFPNKEGVLGTATLNISRCAQLADIKIQNGADLMEKLKAFQENIKSTMSQQEKVKSPEEKSGLGFNNKHPGKRPS